VVTAIVYLYYHVGHNSVMLAKQFGLTSPGVRQILSRLNKCWWYLQHPGEAYRPGDHLKPSRIRDVERRSQRAEIRRLVHAGENIDAELNEFIKQMTGEPSGKEK
jgi:hypothetical protein